MVAAGMAMPGVDTAANANATPRNSATSVLDSLTPVAPTSGMVAANPQQASTWGDLAGNLWGGVKRGIVGMANAPTTLLNAEGALIQRTINSGAGKQVVPETQIAGLPTPQVPEPKDAAGRVAQRVGEFLPGIAAGAIGEGPALAGMAKQVAPAVLGGIGSSLAEDAAPEPLKPAASLLGAVAGGGGAAAVQEAAIPAAARATTNAAGKLGLGAKQNVGGVNVTAPQMQNAAGQVTRALGDEGAQRLQVGAGTPTLPGYTPEQLVPGAEPTTAQVAQTPGAAALEKAHRVATPEPFLAREQQQNSARLASVQGLAPADAQPGAVGDLFRQQLQVIDASGQQAVQQAQGGVQAATGALGGTQPTAAYGEQARTALQAAKEPVHADTQRLWSAVDPDGTWALPAPATKTAAQQLMGEISPTSQTDAQETALLQRAAGLPDVVRFGDLGDMRADINAATRRLSGAPGMEPNVRRLTILKQSVDQSISDALNGRAAQEAQAVAAGQMTPEQTVSANLQRQVNDWYAARNATAAAQAAGGNSGGDVLQAPARGSSATSGLPGTASQASGRFGNPSGTQGVSSQAQPLEPNFTSEHADAYGAAVNATRQEKQTFGQGGVGQVLRPGRNGAEYAVEPGAVPGKIFTRGPTEPLEVQRFISAVGGPDQAAQIGRETLANELRQSGIIKPDGTVDAGRFATWQARRQATIQQFPGLSDQFGSAEAAQRTLDDVTATHQAALKEFQNSAAAKFINAEPSKAVASAFSSANPTATFTQLVRQVRGNTDAEAGLKRAVVDYITDKTRSATPAGTGEDFQKAATFRTFIRQNNGALKALFGGQGVQNLDMVAADLRRQAQRTTATAGSDTAANITAARHYGLKESGFHATALAVIGEQMGNVLSHAMGGEGILGQAAGAAIGGGGYLIHAMRQSGIATINDLVREAMLHPNVARELMAKAQNSQIGPVASQRIARALQGTLTANAAQNQQQEKQ